MVRRRLGVKETFIVSPELNRASNSLFFFILLSPSYTCFNEQVVRTQRVMVSVVKSRINLFIATRTGYILLVYPSRQTEGDWGR